MKDRTILLRAARYLQDEAEILRRSNTNSDGEFVVWKDGFQYRMYVQTVKELREMAKRK